MSVTSKLLKNPIFQLFIALLLGARLSEKLSVTVTRILLVLAFWVAVVGFRGVPYLTKRPRLQWLSIIGAAAALFALGAWAVPDPIPISLGVLSPKSHLLFSFFSNQSEIPKLEIDGTNVILAFNGPKGEAMIKTLRDSLLTIESVRGQIKVSAEIRDKDGKLIAELNRNEWKIGSNAWDRNYTKDALEVIDASGNVVLQVKVLPDRIQLQGEWWDQYGSGIRIAADPSITKIDGGPSAVIMPLSKTYDPPDPKIEKMFEYPSETHLGELKPR